MLANKAGQYISLEPGFETEPGANFTAEIGDICSGTKSMNFNIPAPVIVGDSKICGENTFSVENADNNVIVYYRINFNEGGWVMISNSEQTKPILAYSKNGEFNSENIPPALEQLLNYYKSSIYEVITNNIKNSDFNQEWEILLNYHSNKSTYSTQTNNFCLLDKPIEGTVYWSQEYNNDGFGHCTPCYNKYCPDKTDNSWSCIGLSTKNCYCDYKPVGCGAVAMGEIMWYWRWPISYNWSIIPTELKDNTPTYQANELARLLHDCGIKANMNYCCNGSWATTNNVCDGLIDLGFESAQVKIRNQISDNAWKQLLRTELDAERPVLYRGGAVIDPGDWGNVHYFVCDGYDRDNTDYFHFNWGWGYTSASDCSNNILFTIDNLNPGGNDYSDQQDMIIGISPTCTQLPQNITTVPYSQVFDTKIEKATNNITLPAIGATLTVEAGGNLTLVAGNSIVIKSGFHAKSGSFFHAYLSQFNCDCGGDLSVPTWYNFLSPNGDGYNDELCFYVYNGNSYEVHIIDNNNNFIYQGSGSFINDFACVWDGTGGGGGDYCYNNGSYLYCTYRAIIIFRNNCGQLVDNDYIITVAYPLTKVMKLSQDSVNKNEYIFDNYYNNVFKLYPNPNNGVFTLSYNETPEQFNISIINSIGDLIYENHSSTFPFDIDISKQPQGIYYLKAISKNYQFIKKVIKL